MKKAGNTYKNAGKSHTLRPLTDLQIDTHMSDIKFKNMTNKAFKEADQEIQSKGINEFSLEARKIREKYKRKYNVD